MTLPIVDMHCDLLSYLATTPDADAMNTTDIGCAIPHLQKGHVKLQVLAMFTRAEPGSSEIGLQESAAYRNLLRDHGDKISPVNDVQALAGITESDKIGVVAAIENAAGFCEADDTLAKGFQKLEQMIANVGRILYVTMTHHTENRFGGGNMSDNVGLKPDGEALLDYLHSRKIAVDFSHTSDALAEGTLTYMTKHNLDIPVLASHSNFRAVYTQARNLPDEIAGEIMHRGGLISLNFIRDFLNPENPAALKDHLLHGLEIGAEDYLAFGADYFYPEGHPGKYYFDAYKNAGEYQNIVAGLKSILTARQLERISFRNAADFIREVWS